MSIQNLDITKFKVLLCFKNVFRLPLGISSIQKDANWRTRKGFEGLHDLQSFYNH